MIRAWLDAQVADLVLRKKLFLMLAFPLAGMVVFMAAASSNTVSVMNLAKNSDKMVHLARTASAALRTLQYERGMTALFLEDSGKRFKTELLARRRETDQAVAALELANGASDPLMTDVSASELNAALHQIRTLESRRRSVDAMTLSSGEAIDFYEGINSRLLRVISHFARKDLDPSISRPFIAYSNLLIMLELAGLERAELGRAFTSQRLPPRASARIRSLQEKQQVYLELLGFYVTTETSLLVEAAARGPLAAEFGRMRGMANRGDATADPVLWFKAASARIERYQKIADGISGEIGVTADRMHERARNWLIFYLLLAGFSLTAALVIATLVVTNITGSVDQLSSAAERISSGDINVEVSCSSRDEIGGLADSFRHLLTTLKEKVSVADQIAMMKLDVDIRMVSGRDALGRSLIVMRDHLRASWDAREKSLREKELLLKDVHHRVKNNLQVIVSLLRMAAERATGDAAEALEESRGRIAAIAVSHDLLYRSEDLKSIPAPELLRSLSRELSVAHAAPDPEVAADPVELSMDVAVPLGLLIGELMSNAYKHGYESGKAGRVRIELHRRGDRLRLSVRDWGRGVPSGFESSAQGLGLRLIVALTRQLGGASAFRDAGPGLTAEVEFPHPSQA